MTVDDTGLSKSDFAKLERTLNRLTAKLAEQAQYLEKHTGALENLTQAIKHLDTTIKKEICLESSQPSLQLKEAINTFVEYTINPRYYKDPGLLKLKAAVNQLREEVIPSANTRARAELMGKHKRRIKFGE